jgi:hypothetical protein
MPLTSNASLPYVVLTLRLAPCSAADIQRQLAAESKAFISVDRQFKDIMRKAKDRPNAMLVRI